jgi:hypothetical protein
MSIKRKTATVAPSSRKLPEWITNHFKESLNSHETLMQIVHISERGIGVLRGIPKIVKVLADVDGKAGDPSSAKHLEQAEKEASLAATEIEKGFPVLHCLAVVALWSWLEHCVKGFLALWLLHRRDAINVAAVQKLRVKLGDYLQLQKAEQAHFLVELLEQDLASPLKRGATRFESLLEPFGLSGALPDGCAQTLFELQQVRNAIAHRNGRADRRLRTQCPWLKLRLNQPVHVSGAMLQGYSNASGEFLLTLLYRVGDRYGTDLRVKSGKAPNPPVKPTATGKPVAAA